MAESKMIIHVWHLSYNVTTGINSAISIYKHIRLSPNTNKHNKNTETVLQFGGAQGDKSRLPGVPNIRRQRLCIVTSLDMERNTKLRHPILFPNGRVARTRLLATLENTPPAFRPKYTSSPSSGLHTRPSILEGLQGHWKTTTTKSKTASMTLALPHSATKDLHLS